MEKAIKNLENKLNNFIGFSKDPITTAEARGFKSGLMWAIDTSKTIKYQEDEFAIGFAEWIRVCKLKRRPYNFENTKELLTIYKNEKGL